MCVIVAQISNVDLNNDISTKRQSIIIIGYQRLFNVRSLISKRITSPSRLQNRPERLDGSRPFEILVTGVVDPQSQSAGFMPAACAATFLYLTCFAPVVYRRIDLRGRDADCPRDIRTCDTARYDSQKGRRASRTKIGIWTRSLKRVARPEKDR